MVEKTGLTLRGNKRGGGRRSEILSRDSCIGFPASVSYFCEAHWIFFLVWRWSEWSQPFVTLPSVVLAVQTWGPEGFCGSHPLLAGLLAHNRAKSPDLCIRHLDI